MPAEKFDFRNAQGHTLAALLDRPDGPIRAVALFAHCFTCGKSNRAARHIAEGLKLHGIAVLRFDFTGLGASEGEFANTTFSSNVDGLFGERVAELDNKDEVEVTLAGRPFRIRRTLLDDIAQQNLKPLIADLHKALLMFHSPTDDTVGIDNASEIFLAAKHPKSFISLAGADHLISRASDATYVARVIAAWADRYLDMAVDAEPTADTPPGTVAVRETRRGQFQQEVILGKHRLLADEPVKDGGLDTGPGPYDLLLAALGACTSMTVRLYADLKQIPLLRTQVRLHHEKIYASDCAECETKEGKIDRIDRAIAFEGDLTDEQRKRLLEIADKCPVHRTLESEINIRTVEDSAPPTK